MTVPTKSKKTAKTAKPAKPADVHALAALFTDEEVVILAMQLANPSPADVAMLMNLAIAQLLTAQGVDPVRKLNALGRALRTRAQLSQDGTADIQDAIADALDMLSDELGIEL